MRRVFSDFGDVRYEGCRYKAFAKWSGVDETPGVGGGPFEWTGGTGKYAGISGDNTFRYALIGDTLAYSGVWEGEWQLP